MVGTAPRIRPGVPHRDPTRTRPWGTPPVPRRCRSPVSRTSADPARRAADPPTASAPPAPARRRSRRRSPGQPPPGSAPPTGPPAGRSRTRAPARPAPGRRRQAQRYGSARADSRASLLPLRGHGFSEPGDLVVQRRTAVGPQLALDRREPAVEAVQPRVQAVEPAVEPADAALEPDEARQQTRAAWHPRPGRLPRNVIPEEGRPR